MESKKRRGGKRIDARPVQRPRAGRCTQVANNGRQNAEQCGIQATSQCTDQRNNERSHCGLQADARPEPLLFSQASETASTPISRQPVSPAKNYHDKKAKPRV